MKAILLVLLVYFLFELKVIDSYCKAVYHVNEAYISNMTVNYTRINCILCQNTIRRIPDDNFTLDFLGFHRDNVTIIESGTYIIGEPISSLIPIDNSPDDITRRHILKFNIMNGPNPLITELRVLPEPCFNPSITTWSDMFLVVCRFQGIGESPMTMALIDRNNYSLTMDDRIGFTNLSYVTLNNVTYGEDYRILKVNESSYLVSYTHVHREIYRVKYFYIHMNTNTHSFSLNNMFKLKPYGNEHHHHGKVPHKNWCPFIYNNTILFVTEMDPLHVIEFFPNSVDSETWVETQTYSISPSVRLPKWSEDGLGSLHGGTSAFLINKDTYFGFFHSSGYLKYNFERSYFFGAYTFTAQPPFRITSMSQAPIVDKSLYDGPWSIWNKYWRKIDYIIFPMSFVFLGNDTVEDKLARNEECSRDCLVKQDILLSFGWQDSTAMTAKLNLFDVLESLVPVEVQ